MHTFVLFSINILFENNIYLASKKRTFLVGLQNYQQLKYTVNYLRILNT
jgi:hypothetical protein